MAETTQLGYKSETSPTGSVIRWLADCGHWINGPIVVKRQWLSTHKSECAQCYLNRFLEPDGSEGEDYRITREAMMYMDGPLDRWHCWGPAGL